MGALTRACLRAGVWDATRWFDTGRRVARETSRGRNTTDHTPPQTVGRCRLRRRDTPREPRHRPSRVRGLGVTSSPQGDVVATQALREAKVTQGDLEVLGVASPLNARKVASGTARLLALCAAGRSAALNVPPQLHLL